MIYDLRQYTLAPGTQDESLRINQEIGRPIRGDDYGILKGYWITEFGTLNRMVHLWEYEDLNQRERLRSALGQHPAWKRDYSPIAQRNIVDKRFDILYPVIPLAAPQGSGNVYELRWYKTRPDGAREFGERIQAVEPLVARFVSQIGLLRNEHGEVVQLLAYRSWGERAAALARLEQEPQWQAFAQQSNHLLASVTATALRPSKFSPMQ